jgi:hypothetical protein
MYSSVAMTPILIGYFPKHTERKPDWLNAAGVEEICSASCCISQGPDDWVTKWLHNEMWVYDTSETAWSVVPDSLRPTFDLYAYKLFPVLIEGGQQKPLALPKINAQPLSTSFMRLGYDAVSRSSGTAFECSPLSCNLMAKEIQINRYCLLDEPETAFRKALEFEQSGCEPGPYLVVEVWRSSSEWRQRGLN